MSTSKIPAALTPVDQKSAPEGSISHQVFPIFCVLKCPVALYFGPFLKPPYAFHSLDFFSKLLIQLIFTIQQIFYPLFLPILDALHHQELASVQ